MTVKAIHLPIYGGKVILITGRKTFLREYAKLTDESLDLDDAAGCSSEHGMCYLVGVFNGKPSVLVHELAHTTFKILHDRNVPVQRDGQMEAFCYLLEWLFGQCAPLIRKRA